MWIMPRQSISAMARKRTLRNGPITAACSAISVFSTCALRPAGCRRCLPRPKALSGARRSTSAPPMIPEYHLTVERTVRAVLADVLGIAPERAAAFRAETGLFGSLPELDSMAVAGLLTEIEDRLGIVIEDDEVDGDMLATFGALVT